MDTPSEEEAKNGKEVIRRMGLKTECWDVWLAGRVFLGRVLGKRDEAISEARARWPQFAGQMELWQE